MRLGADLISQVKQLTLRCEHPQATEGRLEERRQRDGRGKDTEVAFPEVLETPRKDSPGCFPEVEVHSLLLHLPGLSAPTPSS